MKTVPRKSKQLNLYGAKSLYLVQAFGKSKVKHNPDKDYNLLEERVILIFARNFEEAIKKATKEAHDYQSEFINPYGQKVKTTFLECIDVYEMYDELKDKVEIYSINYLVNKNVTKKQTLDSHYGKDLLMNKETKIRIKFLNKDFSHFPEDK